MEKKEKIDKVIIFQNGMVAVFDKNGNQIPYYQGFIFEVAEKLAEGSDKDTKFSLGVPGIGEINCNFSWWFINKRNQPPGM